MKFYVVRIIIFSSCPIIIVSATPLSCRPLPSEMVKYAREDTHYLLYIYDRMSNELIRRGNKRDNLVRLVLDNSRALCAKPYLKLVVTKDSYLKLYYKHKRQFNSQQVRYRVMYEIPRVLSLL